jgi:hypothetical protein
MPAAVAVNGHGNGNGAIPKSSSAKSRSALKRLKAKAKAANGGKASDTASEAGTESDAEVCLPRTDQEGMRVDKDPVVSSFLGIDGFLIDRYTGYPRPE